MYESIILSMLLLNMSRVHFSTGGGGGTASTGAPAAGIASMAASRAGAAAAGTGAGAWSILCLICSSMALMEESSFPKEANLSNMSLNPADMSGRKGGTGTSAVGLIVGHGFSPEWNGIGGKRWASAFFWRIATKMQPMARVARGNFCPNIVADLLKSFKLVEILN